MLSKNTFFAILLIFVPLSIAGSLLHWGGTVVFITACLAIIPLAAYMGEATEAIAVVVGPNIGGLMNATFGNATELILAYVALREGFIDVVKATITGSIIGNLLLVMGLSMFLGGLRFKEQEFGDSFTHCRGIYLHGSRGSSPATSIRGRGSGVNFRLWFKSLIFHENPHLSLRCRGCRYRGGKHWRKHRKAENLVLVFDFIDRYYRRGRRIGVIGGIPRGGYGTARFNGAVYWGDSFAYYR